MRYSRDKSGAIDGAYAMPQPFSTEELPGDHPDVLAWATRSAPSPSPLDVLLEAVRGKLGLTQAELDAAKARLMAARR